MNIRASDLWLRGKQAQRLSVEFDRPSRGYWTTEPLFNRRLKICKLFEQERGELFLIPASVPRLVKQRPWYVLSCLWDGAYKRSLAVNRKE